MILFPGQERKGQLILVSVACFLTTVYGQFQIPLEIHVERQVLFRDAETIKKNVCFRVMGQKVLGMVGTTVIFFFFFFIFLRHESRNKEK